MYRIELQKQPRKALEKLPKPDNKRIIAKLKLLAQNPYAPNNNVKKLQQHPGYRLRVGDWRVIYRIIDEKVLILVIKIGPRGEVYK